MNMQIKVCGMRDSENIEKVMELGIDYIGLIFWEKSPRYVKDININAGIIPDKPCQDFLPSKKLTLSKQPALVGVFVNEMPQTVITHAYNYKLDYIQLHGNESAIYIENLKRTIIPDILPNVKIIKAISIREADDVKRWHEYNNHADLLLFDTKCKSIGGSGEKFDWSILKGYDGNIPFILSGGIGEDDAETIKAFNHPKCIGIDLNSKFETEPAIKDIGKLSKFINEIKAPIL